MNIAQGRRTWSTGRILTLSAYTLYVLAHVRFGYEMVHFFGAAGAARNLAESLFDPDAILYLGLDIWFWVAAVPRFRKHLSARFAAFLGWVSGIHLLIIAISICLVSTEWFIPDNRVSCVLWVSSFVALLFAMLIGEDNP